MTKTFLVTGAAGFIGFHLCKRLIKENFKIVALDNLNPYYSTKLKKSRIAKIGKQTGDFFFIDGDIENIELLERIFKEHKPQIVINLAAQAGVRYSISNPISFLKTNVVGFGNILEVCRKNDIEHLIYASSSSVYGGNKKLPYREDSSVDHPVSLYAATKKSNELMAHTYSHLYSLPATGLRFFTVYGPWGRPDMSYFLFTKAIFEKKSIEIYNYGDMDRDFTYIDDIIESLIRLANKIPKPEKNFDSKNPIASSSWAPHRIFNIGNSNKVKLIDFINIIENEIGIKAIKNFLPMQKGDVQSTLADTSLLEQYINFKPQTSLDFGIKKFIEWYRLFYNI
tara:strand:+ start:224 stop:1240 length:1017 start_codon:yes stop_codon:yes gene_type:complete